MIILDFVCAHLGYNHIPFMQGKKMKSIKFKLLIFVGITVLIFSALLIYRTHNLVTSNIENLTRQELTLALDFNLAIREYVAETLRPLMFKLVDKGKFIPETMSTSFVARSIFEKVRKKHPSFIIKFSAGNPRNPINQAGAEELNMIKYFNDHPQKTNWAGNIEMNGKQYVAIFYAMRMKTSCLRCHGNSADAPYGLLKQYGPDAAFHHSLGEVVGLDTVAVPKDTVEQMLWDKDAENIGFLTLLILMLSAALVFVLKFVMTDRLSKISQHLLDSRQQNEDFEIKSIEINGKDEIAGLTENFNKLATRLNNTYAKLRKEIENRRLAQKALVESEEKYRKLFDMESDALVLVDIETGKLLEINRAFIRLYGYTREEIQHMKNTDFSAEPDKTLKATQDRQEYIPLRYHKKKNGTVFPVEITANMFEYQGRNVYIIAIRDITDRKNTEQQIEASLKIKEVLLNEIHHRVKNNFEIISSLLDMSSMTTDNKEIQDILLSSRSRIHSMAMIHSQLYQSDRFDNIDMSKHTHELAENLRFLYGKEKDVDLTIESSEVYLSIKYAIPCALILNELITNALKHAFSERMHGKIQVSIQKFDDTTVRLNVKDDGKGIQEKEDAKPSGALGLELVKHLVNGQLKGEIQINTDNGTDISIEFNT
jgi:PAS domain S-box-containing protein